MKDIKDLKENECIHIRNKKEAKGIAKLCKNDMPLIGYRVYEDRTTYYPSTEQYADTEYSNCSKEKIIPASKFLKPSKKELLKRIEQLEKSLALYSVVTQVVDNGNTIAEYNRTKVTPPDNLEVNFEKVEAKSIYEAGKWYKDPESQFLVFVRNYDANDVSASVYGFGEAGVWIDAVVDIQGTVLATEEEVKEALTAEAERRGFKIGTMIKSIIHIRVNSTLKQLGRTDFTEEGFYYYGCVVMQNGKWADIIEQPQEEIDFSQVGLIVESESKSVVVFTNGFANYKDGQFSGIVIHSTNAFFKVKDVYDTFYTKEFKLRKEPITISNEIN